MASQWPHLNMPNHKVLSTLSTCIVELEAFSHLDQLPVATHVGAEESSQYRFRSPFRFQKRLRVLVCVVALQWREWFMLK